MTAMTANVKVDAVDEFVHESFNPTALNTIKKPAKQSPIKNFPTAQSSETGSSQPTNGSDKLERIREIVFGSQAREYTQLFDTMSRDIARLEQETRHLNEQSLTQKQAFQTKLDRQEKEHADQLQALNQQFAQKLQAQEEQYRTKHAEIDEKQSQDIQDLQNTVRRMQDELYTEMRQTSERLNEEKTDRSTLGNLLIELGTNLREGPSESLMAGLLEHLNEDM